MLGYCRQAISPCGIRGSGQSEVEIQRHSQVCRQLRRGVPEGVPAAESRRGASVFGLGTSIVREAASREPVTGGLVDSGRSARDFGRTTTNPEAKYGAASCTGIRAVIFFHLFAPAKAGKKHFLQKDWTTSVGANAFFPLNTFGHPGTVGRPVSRHLDAFVSVGQTSILAASVRRVVLT